MAHRSGPFSLPALPFILFLPFVAWGLGLAIVHAGFVPYSIDYGEGLTLTGAFKMAEGGLSAGYAYNDAYYHAPVLDYPPLYPMLVAGLYKLGLPLVAGGRVLALLSCLAVGVILALLARSEGAPRWLVRICIVLPFGTFPFVLWGGVARVDSLGLALTLLGFYIATGPGSKVESPRSKVLSNRLSSIVYRLSSSTTSDPGLSTLDFRLVLAAACFALALFTKQSMVAAPAVVVIAGLLVPGQRKRALALAGMIIVLSLLFLAGAQWATDGEYWNIITIERGTPFSVTQALANYLYFISSFAALLVLACAGWWRLRKQPATLREKAILLYGPLAFLLAASSGKLGASLYYFMELAAVTILLAVIGYIGSVHRSTAAASSVTPVRRVWAGLLGFALLVQVATNIGLAIFSPNVQVVGMLNVQATGRVVERLRTMGTADVLTDVPGLLLQAGRVEHIYDRFILHQLSLAGLRDDSAVVDDLRRQRWKLLVLSFDPFAEHPTEAGDESWPRAFYNSVRSSYLLVEAYQPVGGAWPRYFVLVPK
jgi:hypothetical protein